jgi:hypothetical protein
VLCKWDRDIADRDTERVTEFAYVLTRKSAHFRIYLYDILALRMSPNAASAQPEKQSFHYIVRSGLAGGAAGCVVRLCFPSLALSPS